MGSAVVPHALVMLKAMRKVQEKEMKGLRVMLLVEGRQEEMVMIRLRCLCLYGVPLDTHPRLWL